MLNKSLKRHGADDAHHVPLLVVLVLDDEDHVEAGQDGGHEVDVVLTLRVVPATEHGVGGGEHRAARVQGGGDAGLGGAQMLGLPRQPSQRWFCILTRGLR